MRFAMRSIGTCRTTPTLIARHPAQNQGARLPTIDDVPPSLTDGRLVARIGLRNEMPSPAASREVHRWQRTPRRDHVFVSGRGGSRAPPARRYLIWSNRIVRSSAKGCIGRLARYPAFQLPRLDENMSLTAALLLAAGLADGLVSHVSSPLNDYNLSLSKNEQRYSPAPK